MILASGIDDLAAAYPLEHPGIAANIRAEAGTSADAFAVRSALPRAERIRSPTAILHGGDGDRFSVDQAQALACAPAAHRVPVRLELFPSAHRIPIHAADRVITPWLDQLVGS